MSDTTKSRGSPPTPLLPVPHLPVAIIGSGFSGLCMAIKLRQAGFDDFVLFEKADEVGGTWRDNTYPGCACDVPSHLYSFSFAPKSDWSHVYARQPEILAYLKSCADEFQLRPFIRFGKKLLRAEFHDDEDAYLLSFADGTSVKARAVVSGIGGLHIPAFPDLKGRESFTGTSFHSAEWNHGYDFRGKRVGVIGTGASAIQFVPQIAPVVASLRLFQRTPPWIVPRMDRSIRRAEKLFLRHVPGAQKLLRARLYSQLESRAVLFNHSPRLLALASRLASGHLRRQIADPQLRAKLSPSYTMGCKRVLISNDYYPALAQQHVDVIREGISEVTATGVRDKSGRHHELDVIIYATGFRVHDFIERGMIQGRGGLDIVDAWPTGPEAYLGINVAGFPNLFFLQGPNTGLGHNSMVYMIESQVHYVMDALGKMHRLKLRRLEVKRSVQQRFNSALQKRLGSSVWSSGCKSWYVNEHGKNIAIWPGFTFRYRQKTRALDLDDYETS